MTSNTPGYTYIYLVETSGIDHSTKRAAFTAEDDANAYAAGLEEFMRARVRRIPLDRDFQDDRRTIIELDRDGGVQRAESRIITGDCITQAFFTGDPVTRAATRGAPGSAGYRNIRMRLESEDTNRERAMALAREIHRRAVSAGIWPEEGSAHDARSNGDLQEILRQAVEEGETK